MGTETIIDRQKRVLRNLSASDQILYVVSILLTFAVIAYLGYRAITMADDAIAYFSGKNTELPDIGLIELGIIVLISRVVSSLPIKLRKKALSKIPENELTEEDKKEIASYKVFEKANNDFRSSGTSLIKWGIIFSAIAVIMILFILGFL